MEDPACLPVSIGLSLEDVELANLAQEFQEEVPVLPLNRCMNHLDLFLLVMFYGLGSHGICHHSTAIWENMFETFQELCQILLVYIPRS